MSPEDGNSLVKGVPRAGRTGSTLHAHSGPRGVAAWSTGWERTPGGQHATADLLCLQGMQEDKWQGMVHIPHC